MTHPRHKEVNASWVSALAEALSVPVGEPEAGTGACVAPANRSLGRSDIGDLSLSLEPRALARGPIVAQPTAGRCPRRPVASPAG